MVPMNSGVAPLRILAGCRTEAKWKGGERYVESMVLAFSAWGA